MASIEGRYTQPAGLAQVPNRIAEGGGPLDFHGEHANGAVEGEEVRHYTQEEERDPERYKKSRRQAGRQERCQEGSGQDRETGSRQKEKAGSESCGCQAGQTGSEKAGSQGAPQESDRQTRHPGSRQARTEDRRGAQAR